MAIFGWIQSRLTIGQSYSDTSHDVVGEYSLKLPKKLPKLVVLRTRYYLGEFLTTFKKEVFIENFPETFWTDFNEIKNSSFFVLVGILKFDIWATLPEKRSVNSQLHFEPKFAVRELTKYFIQNLKWLSLQNLYLSRIICIDFDVLTCIG